MKSDHSEQLTVVEAGRRGGLETKTRHGSEFFRRIGAKGGAVTKARYAHLLGQFGRRGGRPRRPNLNMGGTQPEKKEGNGRPGCCTPPA